MGELGLVESVELSPDGKYLVSGTKFDNSVIMWRTSDVPNSGEEVAAMDFGSTVNELFFSRDDEYLLAVGHGAVKVFQTADWSLAQTLKPDYYVTFTSGVFSPDDQYVFAVGQSDQNRGNGYIWDWQSGKLAKTFNHLGKKIESVAGHPNGRYIAYAGHDPHIFVYRADDILEKANDRIPVAAKIWAGDHAEYIDFNRDGSFLASAHQNGLIKVWAWMGEDPELNDRRHQGVKATQTDAKLR